MRAHTQTHTHTQTVRSAGGEDLLCMPLVLACIGLHGACGASWRVCWMAPVACMHAHMQVVGGTPVVLAGNSLGGYASLATAAYRPDIVR